MRKLSFTLLVISTILIISSCMVPKSEVRELIPPDNIPEEVTFATQGVNGVYTSDLIVGYDTVIGTIEYWVDSENSLLYVDFFATENGWKLTETRVATALDLSDLPRNPQTGRLDPKLYPNFNVHNPAESTSGFVLPLGSFVPGTKTLIYFSAYAEALRNGSLSYSEVGYTAPCIYYAIIYTEPVVELRPILNVDVSGEIELSRVKEYDWMISKDASPVAIVDLEQGEDAPVDYTLTATRLTPTSTDTYTLSGLATVTNHGSLQAEEVGLKVYLLGKNGGDWTEIASSTLIETSTGVTIAASDLVGIGKPFSFTFDPQTYGTFRILAEAEDNWPELVDDYEDLSLPSSPSTETVIDESASIVDMPVNLLEFEGEGFSVNHADTWPWSVSPWELNDVPGGSKTYSIIIKNVSAPKGDYSLTNVATLTENDTGQERVDNARVLVSTPQPVIEEPSMDVTVDSTITWVKTLEYDWSIEKEATPTSITLAQGSSKDIDYTLVITRESGQATYTYTISGTVTVSNTGNIGLTNIAGSVSLNGYSGKESSFGPTNLAVGGSEDFTFSFTVESATPISGFTVDATADSNETDPDTDSDTQSTPADPVSINEIDETADVIDEVTGSLPSGFGTSFTVDPREWTNLTGDATYTYTVTITNNDSTVGGTLTNTATVTEDDTGEYDYDDEEVDVNVPGFNVTVDSTVTWVKTLEYDWSIEKEATPTSITLAQGSSKDIDYTLVITRESGQATYTYTISGTVTVSNSGETPLTGVGGKVTLVGYGKESSFGPVPLAVGGSEDFTFSFTVESATPISGFTVDATADSNETGPDSDSDTQSTPADPLSINEIDETADVIDEVTGSLPSGFGTSFTVDPREWTNLTGDATYTYTVTITNNDSTVGGTLTNTATVTEDDTGEYDYDDEEVDVNVPGFNVTVDSTVTWVKTLEYDWSIEKEATPTSITLAQGSSKDIDYTLVITRESGQATYTYTISGTVTVSNSGETPLTGVGGKVTLVGYGKESSFGPTNLAVGGSEGFTFSFTVESATPISGFTVDATADSNETDPDTDSDTQSTPADPVSINEIDETADVIDEVTGSLPSGFGTSFSVDQREWTDLTGDATYTYTVTITNNNSTVGGTLTNTATVTEDDTGEYDYDDEEVDVNVPSLNVTVDSTITWVKTLEYDWTIEKEATPTLVTLGIGEESSILYTIATVRSPGDATYTYTISGTVTVTNIGETPLTNVEGDVSLVGFSGKTSSFGPSSLALGGSQDITFSFTVESSTPVSSFQVSANVDSAETGPDSDSDTQSAPVDPLAVIEIDEMADLEDLITNVPAGFSINPSTLNRSWPDLSDSATKTYSLVLKNESALPSGSPYFLTNTATVTEDDTGEYDYDDAEVKIVVPEPGLNAAVEASVSREDKVEYDWTIEKSASPTLVTLGIGEEVPIDYTIEVTREPWETVDSTYTITVTAKVKNNGPGSALGVKIVLKITETGDEVTLADGITMIEGEEKTYNKTFTTKTYSPSYTAVLTVTSTNDGSPSDDDTASTPSDLNIVEYVDETADLEDLITNVPAGFSINPSTLNRSWPDLSDSATKTYSLVLRNVSATSGTYYLTNIATVTENDTSEENSDDAVVTITVQGESWSGDTAWGGNYLVTSGAAWWYYFDTEGPATQAIYAGQNLVDGASVTYDQNSGAITIVLGPNMRLKTGSGTVKIAGYDEGELPSIRPAMGSSNPNQIYSGTDLVISVDHYRYYAIHLDVEVKD